MRRTHPAVLCCLLPLALSIAGCGDDDPASPDASVDASPDAPGALCETLPLAVLPVQVDVPVTGTTTGTTLTGPHEGCYGAAIGAEAVYAFELTQSGVDLVWEVQADFNAVAYIRRDCDGLDASGATIAELACADVGTGTETEIARLAAAEPGTYYLFVDGYTTADSGAFTATLSVNDVALEGEPCDETIRCAEGLYCNDTGVCSYEIECNDLVDQDADTLLDCQDPTSCQGTAACTPGAGAGGSACTAPTDCEASGGDPSCLAESLMAFPGGYCSEYCDPEAQDCSSDGICYTFDFIPTGGICFDGCTTTADCRTGYACVPQGGPLVCWPRCTSDAECAVAGHCNLDTGWCSDVVEECTGGVEDDGDGFVDCEDRGCLADATCTAAAAAACEAPAAYEAPVTADTIGGTATLAGSCTGFGAAPERVYAFTPGVAGETGLLTIELQSDTDQGFYVRTACADATTEIACVDWQYGGANELGNVVVEGGVPLIIVVDGWGSPDEAGPFILTVTYAAFANFESEPNDTIADADVWVGPWAGQIEPIGDLDIVSVDVAEGATLVATVTDNGSGACAASVIDSEVEILAADGTTSLAFNDDISDTNWCSRATAATLTAGTYYVKVRPSQMYAPGARFVYGVDVSVTP